jgi:hypothetical protein
MRAILGRWNDLRRDPQIAAAIEAGKLVNQLAAAIEVEMPKQLAAKKLKAIKN